jgi:hypothetical protein
MHMSDTPHLQKQPLEQLSNRRILVEKGVRHGFFYHPVVAALGMCYIVSP